MQRVCVQTKRFFSATNCTAEPTLNNYGRHVVGCPADRECVGSPRVAHRQQGGEVVNLPHLSTARGQQAAGCGYGPSARVRTASQLLGGRLAPFVVHPVRLPAKTLGLRESGFTLSRDHGFECAHCDCLISWPRARRLHRRFREVGGFRARITLPTPFAPVPCGWCWRMI